MPGMTQMCLSSIQGLLWIHDYSQNTCVILSLQRFVVEVNQAVVTDPVIKNKWTFLIPCNCFIFGVVL